MGTRSINSIKLLRGNSRETLPVASQDEPNSTTDVPQKQKMVGPSMTKTWSDFLERPSDCRLGQYVEKRLQTSHDGNAQSSSSGGYLGDMPDISGQDLHEAAWKLNGVRGIKQDKHLPSMTLVAINDTFSLVDGFRINISSNGNNPDGGNYQNYQSGPVTIKLKDEQSPDSADWFITMSTQRLDETNSRPKGSKPKRKGIFGGEQFSYITDRKLGDMAVTEFKMHLPDDSTSRGRLTRRIMVKLTDLMNEMLLDGPEDAFDNFGARIVPQ